MKHILVLIATALLLGCATNERIPTDYAESDAGTVILGMGAARGTYYTSYHLHFRRRDSTGANGKSSPIGLLSYYQNNMFYAQPDDYQNDDEAGVVLVKSLPPGEYELFNFHVLLQLGTVESSYSSKVPISIPFSVKSKGVTYLGNYQARRLTGRNLFGIPLPAGAVFVVSDRAPLEIALAEKKRAAPLNPFQNAAPDARALGNPFFITPADAAAAR